MKLGPSKLYTVHDFDHPFGGSRAKLNRAYELTALLEEETSNYLRGADKVYELWLESSDDLRELHAMARLALHPPLRFGILLGEIVHHLRSALDHTVWALAKRKVADPSERLQFPICTSPAGWENTLKNGAISGVGKGAIDLILQMQPFRQAKPKDTVLAVIQQASNIDKHRVLLVVVAVAALGDVVTVKDSPEFVGPKSPDSMSPTSIVGMAVPPFVVLGKDPASIFTMKFGSPNQDISIDVEVQLSLAVEKLGNTENVELIQLVKMLHQGVAHSIETLEAIL